jgi:hypothetical protein
MCLMPTTPSNHLFIYGFSQNVRVVIPRGGVWYPHVRSSVRPPIRFLSPGGERNLLMIPLLLYPCRMERTFHRTLLYINPIPPPGISPSPIPPTLFFKAVMDRFSSKAQLEIPSSMNEVGKRFIQLESSLDEIKRSLDEVNRGISLLLDRSAVDHASGYRNAFAAGNDASWNGSRPYPAPTTHRYPCNQIPTQNGPAPDDESRRPGEFWSRPCVWLN